MDMASRPNGIESLQDYLQRAYACFNADSDETLKPERSETDTQPGPTAVSKEATTPESYPGESGFDRAASEPQSSEPVTVQWYADQDDTQQVLDPRDAAGQPDEAPGTEYVKDSGPDEAWAKAQECFSEGRSITCLVTGWNRGGLLVRWDELQGFVPASQMKEVLAFESDADREAQLMRRVGEELQLRVIELDPSRNRLVLSERALIWDAQDGDRLLEVLQQGDIRHGRVSNLCNFGAFVDLGGVDGLIHISELAWRRVAHPSEVLEVGQELDVYVLDVDKNRRRIALSLKRLKEDPWLTVEQDYHVGQIVQGTITNVVSFGAFARIEDGLEGLIHISELGEGNFFHPRNVVQEGDVVSLRILRVDSSSHRIGLSLRQASDVHTDRELPPTL